MSFWFVAKGNTHKYNLDQLVAFGMEQLISYIPRITHVSFLKKHT